MLLLRVNFQLATQISQGIIGRTAPLQVDLDGGTEMIGILAINIVIVFLGVGIAIGALPAKSFSGAVTVLHKTIGITLPSPDKERTVAVIWIASFLVIFDGILFLLVFLARIVGRG